MSTRVFLEREGEKEQGQLWRFTRVRNFQLFFTSLLRMKARSSLHNNFPSGNGTIIVSISTSKHIALISKREREGKTGTAFEEQIA